MTEFKKGVPAPLDPSKVKAGDMVTLENGETSVRGPVAHIEKAKHTDVAIGFSIPNVGWRYLVPDVLAQQDYGIWTLTDHQPAPEPERDRLSDVIFEAIRDQPYSYADGADQAAAAVRTAFVVIDPATVNKDILATQAFTSVSVVERVLEQLGLAQ